MCICFSRNIAMGYFCRNGQNNGASLLACFYCAHLRFYLHRDEKLQLSEYQIKMKLICIADLRHLTSVQFLQSFNVFQFLVLFSLYSLGFRQLLRQHCSSPDRGTITGHKVLHQTITPLKNVSSYIPFFYIFYWFRTLTFPSRL